MHLKFIPFLTLAFLILLTSCGTNNVEDIIGECVIEDISYNADIVPILETNCAVATCHDPNDQAAGLNLRDYDMARDFSQPIRGRTNSPGAPMPPSGLLPDCDRLKIEAWVNAGAPNN